MADFSVDPDGLRELASALDRKAWDAQALRSRDREVPTGAWGPIGDDFGLPDLYTDVRDQADTCLAGIHEFLDGIARDLAATAGEYEQHDETLARLFDRIGRDGGAPRHEDLRRARP